MDEDPIMYETVSLEQIFQEEIDALEESITALKLLPPSPENQATILKHEIVKDYFEARLAYMPKADPVSKKIAKNNKLH